MVEIRVQVCGDHWLNRDEVLQKLRLIDSPVQVDLGAEGASLSALGIDAVLLEHCLKHHLDPKLIVICNWPNTVESIQFTRAYNPRISHFVWMSENYWGPTRFTVGAPHRVAFFLGRPTPARAAMMYYLYHRYPKTALLSRMLNHQVTSWQDTGLERLQDWFQDTEQFLSWWNHDPVPSLDQHYVNDQYDSRYNTNLDILSFYADFDLEIVAETYTCGATFFPTEKTFRPIMAMKPFLVYGPPLFLHHLRQLGFQTFQSCWNEDYDLCQGLERWTRMQTVLDDLMLLPDHDWREISASTHKVLAHNRSHLSELAKRYRPQ